MNDATAPDRPVVLIVEDEYWVTLDTAETLEKGGFEVLCAQNGDVALPLLERRPDIRLVFTDINVPGSIDGIELAREIDRRWPQIGVVITSGKTRGTEVAGEWPFVPKPYDPRAVAGLFATMLGLSSTGEPPAETTGRRRASRLSEARQPLQSGSIPPRSKRRARA